MSVFLVNTAIKNETETFCSFLVYKVVYETNVLLQKYRS